ncbi:MAG: methyltransferase [Candidatus Hodarchaeales archaeon]|jgi:ubiquinone/menaquinone biosynthesis C-methylase UbiE
MKIKSKYDIQTILRDFIPSSALNLALQLGLFYDLQVKPMNELELLKKYEFPLHRLVRWLIIFVDLGLLRQDNNIYSVTNLAEEAIIKPYSKESWSLLALEAQKLYPIGNNLLEHFSHPESVLKSQGITLSDWFNDINTNETYARDFTITLFEHHIEFAEKFSVKFNIDNAKKLMDIGGGSGVISLELLKKNPDLEAAVIDVENVCKTGRTIADNTNVKDRIEYLVLDFEKEPLPKNFDIILICDSGVPDKELANKIMDSLTPGGRLVIVTNIDEDAEWLDYKNVTYGYHYIVNKFVGSLCSSKSSEKTVDEVVAHLTNFGFQKVSYNIWEEGELIIEAYKDATHKK